MACQGWDVKQVCPCNWAVRYFWKPEYGSRKPSSAVILSNLCFWRFLRVLLMLRSIAQIFLFAFSYLYFFKFSFFYCLFKGNPNSGGGGFRNAVFHQQGRVLTIPSNYGYTAKWRSCIRYSGSTRNHPTFGMYKIIVQWKVPLVSWNVRCIRKKLKWNLISVRLEIQVICLEMQ